jgi:hypothetical protein
VNIRDLPTEVKSSAR